MILKYKLSFLIGILTFILPIIGMYYFYGNQFPPFETMSIIEFIGYCIVIGIGVNIMFLSLALGSSKNYKDELIDH